jgi:hypothetical protein
MGRIRVHIILTCAVLFFLSFFISDFWIKSNTQKVSSYYNVIENQERLRADVPVTEDELKVIRSCKSNDKSEAETCMRDFYDAYTMQHGPARAFAHLARLQKEHKELLPGCHYISHGIGHASLRLNDDVPSNAFLIMQTGDFFKNVATCGNGYFHGVIEEAAKGITENKALAEKLKSICATASRGTSCYHGAGHAALIQKEYNAKDMVEVCNMISDKPDDVFECHTGGFMEYGQVTGGIGDVKNGKLKLTFCDAQERKYQPACYMEQSSMFENYSSEPRNYSRNIGFCKQFEDALNRMACIKLFAIRSVRISHFNDVYTMCNNTSTTQERIICTAVVASKIGQSRDKERGAEFRSIAKSVCLTMNPLYASYCQHLVFRKPSQLFYTSEQDLSFSTWKDLLFGWYAYYTYSNGFNRT